ncbi:UNVERIFIED_CONTAM: hypothetical protein GTU68_054649 [Idotea baltica]|nr:hypothetical protein [Idotea baltica]
MMLAMDNNKLIGKDNGMPWFIPGELIYFKQVTMGKPIIMGRKTYDSIGRPLPGRPNFVVTRNSEWSAEGVTTCTSLDIAIDAGETYYAEQNNAEQENTDASPEIMIIGGAGLCRDAMPQTQRIYLTAIDNEYEGDIYFDSFDWNDWEERSREDKEHEGLKYSYLVLERPEA